MSFFLSHGYIRPVSLSYYYLLFVFMLIERKGLLEKHKLITKYKYSNNNNQTSVEPESEIIQT
jgi:hypothetical protein